MAKNDYLHGIETLTIERGGRTVRLVKSSVIAVIGTAPCGPVNVPTLLLSDRDDVAFGPETLTAFTLADALADIRQCGGATVVAINVLDPDVHATTVVKEAVTFDARTQQATLAHPAVSRVTMKDDKDAASFHATTDFAVDPLTGVLTRVPSGTIPAGATVHVDYDWADPSKVSAADIIGAVNAAGHRTGLKALVDLRTLFGFTAKVLIAPVFETLPTVAAALEAAAMRDHAVAYIAAPAGLTVTEAITERGPAGTRNFTSSSERVRLCYPYVKVADPVTGGTRIKSMTALVAGLRAQVDADEGVWVSSSNHVLPGVIGLERPLSAGIDDAESEVNQLNAVGITTVFSDYGAGYRLWGNRNASFPSSSGLRTFESVIRTKDLVDESIRVSSLPFVDRAIGVPQLDSITEFVNAFGRAMVGKGALLGFDASWDASRNGRQDLVDGHATIRYKLTPPPNLERLTYESELTDEYVLSLTQGP